MNDLQQQLAPSWSIVNIVITVVLFVISWPLALIMVAYIIWGKKVGLDLSQPRSIGVFAKRISSAWRAAIDSFSNNNRNP
jgi:ABC-type Fe3+ transport system permease subunit